MIPRQIRLLAYLVIAVIANTAQASAKVFKLQGVVGTARIGMTLDITETTINLSTHYFYVTHLKDIPLTGTLSSANGEFLLILNEPSGGIFTLHYKDKGDHPDKFLYTGNNLNGTWSQNGKELPVTLTYLEGYEGGVPDRLYASINSESNEVFEARVCGFRDSVLSGDAKTATKFIRFPLDVNITGHQSLTIKSSRQLKTDWDRIFSETWLAAARAAVPHELFVKDGMAMLGDGLVWFGPKGAQVINTLP